MWSAGGGDNKFLAEAPWLVRHVMEQRLPDTIEVWHGPLPESNGRDGRQDRRGRLNHGGTLDQRRNENGGEDWIIHVVQLVDHPDFTRGQDARGAGFALRTFATRRCRVVSFRTRSFRSTARSSWVCSAARWSAPLYA